MRRMLRKISGKGDEVLAEYDVTTTSPQELKKIEDEFNAKLKQGFFAADITDKRDVLIGKFDPNADILLIPRVQGGA